MEEFQVEYRDLLQTLVDREVLLLEAQIRGMAEDSLAQSRLREDETERLVQEMLSPSYRQAFGYS